MVQLWPFPSVSSSPSLDFLIPDPRCCCSEWDALCWWGLETLRRCLQRMGPGLGRAPPPGPTGSGQDPRTPLSSLSLSEGKPQSLFTGEVDQEEEREEEEEALDGEFIGLSGSKDWGSSSLEGGPSEGSLQSNGN